MRISISIGSAYYNGEEWDSLVDYTMAAIAWVLTRHGLQRPGAWMPLCR